MNVNFDETMASYPSGLRDRFAKPLFAGSNPADASLSIISCLGGGIGRHYGLKIRWQQCRAGSSPAPGTQRETPHIVGFFAIYPIFKFWHIMEYSGSQ